MKKFLLAISLSLLIPMTLISCSKSAKNTKSEENKVSNSSSVNNNNNASSEKDNNTNDKKDNETDEKDNETVDKNDTEKQVNAKIYYYDAVSDKIVYINKSINVTDDNVAKILVDELKKSPNAEISPSISNEITLNSSSLDKKNSTIAIDFSSNFVSAQELGGGSEYSILTAIVNTFGSYFNVENVLITLDGKPYSSGHILMNEREAFKVNLNDAIELK